jgi:hypothetical protein
LANQRLWAIKLKLSVQQRVLKNYLNLWWIEDGSEIEISFKDMSIVEKDEGKVIIKNTKNVCCKCLQNHHHKNWKFWWSYVNSSSLN